MRFGLIGFLVFALMNQPSAGHLLDKPAQTRPTAGWSFSNCRAQGAKDFSLGVRLKDEPGTWTKSRQLEGSLLFGSVDRYDFKLPLVTPLPLVKPKEPASAWTGNAVGEHNGSHFFAAASYRLNAQEDVLTIHTQKPVRQVEPPMTQFTMMMISSRGNLVEAKLTFVGDRFYAYEVLRTCGDGFGQSPEDGVVSIDTAHARMPEGRHPFPSGLSGTAARRGVLEIRQHAAAEYLFKEVIRLPRHNPTDAMPN